MRRALHAKTGDPPFGKYETVKDEEGNFRSTLRLSERARDVARLRKRQYEGEVRCTKKEADLSAARAFWDDPHVKESAAKLLPSNTAKKRKKGCAEQSARRKARRYGTPEMTGAPR